MIISPQNTTVSRQTISDTIRQNRDGFGIAAIMPGALAPIVVRSMGARERTDAKFAWKVWQSFRRDPQNVVFIHARRCVSGLVSDDNTMPIPISKRRGLWLAHNGLASWPIQDDHSDTWHTARYLARFSTKLILSGMEDFAYRTSSRFAVITAKAIYPFGAWEKHDGVHYSNSSLFWTTYATQYQPKTYAPNPQFTFSGKGDGRLIKLTDKLLRDGDGEVTEGGSAVEALDDHIDRYMREHNFRGMRQRIRGRKI